MLHSDFLELLTDLNDGRKKLRSVEMQGSDWGGEDAAKLLKVFEQEN